MKQILIFYSLSVALLFSACASSESLDDRIDEIIKPYVFSVAEWEFNTLIQEIGQFFSNSEDEDSRDETRVVIEYFNSTKRDSVLTGRVEDIIKKQIRDILNEQGIFNPITDGDLNFPPISFRLERMPHLLVVSPRTRIESSREIILKQVLTTREKEAIEAETDELGVSSLVVNLGGIATYPALVDKETGLRFTIDTITEEWLHHYLAFTPLGFRYLLDVAGISRDYEIATMNESLVGIVSEEISDIIYEKYYPEYEKEKVEESVSGFDFNVEMREIRKTVDTYLVKGEVEQAEEFMERKRDYLESKGYYIRKLNQAYFAFYGTYAHSPAYVNPIGLDLRELRNRRASLKEYLNTAAVMTSREDLSLSVR